MPLPPRSWWAADLQDLPIDQQGRIAGRTLPPRMQVVLGELLGGRVVTPSRLRAALGEPDASHSALVNLVHRLRRALRSCPVALDSVRGGWRLQHRGAISASVPDLVAWHRQLSSREAWLASVAARLRDDEQRLMALRHALERHRQDVARTRAELGAQAISGNVLSR